jgi:cytochrome c556
MRTRIVATAAVVVAAAAGTWALAAASLDLSDFNEDIMKDMDDTVKALDSNISAHDVKSAANEAQSIRNGLHWAEDYFAKKGNVEDAVKLAKRGEELADAVGKSVNLNDFDAALTSYDLLVKNCRTCHDAYKPPDL